MGDPNTPKGPNEEKEGLLKPQISADEKGQQSGERAEISDVLSNSGAQSPENPDLKKSPEQLFEEMIRPRIHEIVMAWGLDSVIEECREMLHGSNDRNRPKLERKAAEKLMKAFSGKKLPFKKWAFFPDAMIGEKATNCSGAALVFGVIMNEELGIKTDYASPIGHAANVVTFSDGKTYYFDPRNQESMKIRLGTPRTRDGFDIHKVRVYDFSLLPISKFEHGAMLTVFEVICALKEGQKNDPEADSTVKRYGDGIDFDFAEQYMKGNFLDVRDSEDEWKAEKENVRYNRTLFDSFHMIPNH